MKPQKLVHMANEIAAFFKVYPEEEARAGIKEHIIAFWTPKMRATLVSEGRIAGLNPLVLRALHGDSPAESPIAKETASAGAAGQLASDAG